MGVILDFFIGINSLLFLLNFQNFVSQIRSLEVAKERLPKGRWWIKGDAFDVREGLRESLKGDWSGDADLA